MGYITIFHSKTVLHNRLEITALEHSAECIFLTTLHNIPHKLPFYVIFCTLYLFPFFPMS